MPKKKTTPSVPRTAGWLRGPLPVVALLVLHVALGLSAASRKSITFDETAHLGGGFSYWVKNDYRLHPENGNWSQRWATIPIWWRETFTFEGPFWRNGSVWPIAKVLLFGPGRDADAIVGRGRAMIAVASAVLGLLVYFWSRRLFGAYGGLISLTLYVFSPTMLANGFLATSDLFAALFFTAAMAALWALLQRVTALTLLAACVTTAGLLLSKFSGVLIAPMGLLLLAIRLLNTEPLQIKLGRTWEVTGRLKQGGLFVAIMLAEILAVTAIIWASYGCRFSAFAAGEQQVARFEPPWERLQEKSSPTVNSIVQFALDHHVLPEAYLYGFAHTLAHAQLRGGFLNGEFGLKGWSSFFPFCLAWKTPLTLFLQLLLAGWACWMFRNEPTGDALASARRPGGRFYALAPLIVLFVVYWGVALRSNLNIGHRHLLPTYPPLFILAGAAAIWFRSPRARPGIARKKDQQVVEATSAATLSRRTRATMQWAVIGTLALAAIEALWCWPHYLAYFNILAGGPRNGYRLLVDSSLDWGQDLKELRRWLDRHPDDARDPTRVYLSYFGNSNSVYYGIAAQELPCYFPRWMPHIPQPLTGGLYCISATMLQAVYLAPYNGRWNQEYEARYQELRQVVLPYQRGSTDPDVRASMQKSAAQPEMQKTFRMYELLRFGRLCSCLRQRDPDAQPGYGMLIYRLTDADVAQALEGDPCELLAAPETETDSSPAGDRGRSS
jgi:4-amino-4-deoxy-L-arabinose transferase-like glycosyltransferase